MIPLTTGMAVFLWIVAGLTAATIAVLGWLNLSRRPVAVKYRRAISDKPYPHVHEVDGVVIAHSHVGGHKEHAHTEISVPVSEYVDLVKRADRIPVAH